MIHLNKDAVQLVPGNIPVVFLHAFPMNHKMWEPQIAFLREKGFTSIAPDLPGFGGSQLAESDTLTSYSERICRLLEVLEVHQAVFVGLSMGGYLALELFRHIPEKFVGLLLANTRATADTPVVRERRAEIIKQIEESGELGEVLTFHLENFLTAGAREKNPELKRLVWQILQEASAQSICQAQRAMAKRPDFLDLLQDMQFPVTVVASEGDALTTLEDARAMMERLPDGHLEIIQNSAHLSNMEQPVAFNRALMRLIEKVRG
ncbi:MAG: alpha/beta fold hydrolase [Calditrichia bacterium]